MRCFKTLLIYIMAVILVLSVGACDMISGAFRDETPQLMPHFISEDERDSVAYIPLLEAAKEDSTLFMDFETTTENAQVEEFLEILEFRKMPRIDENDPSITARVKELWSATEQIFLNYTNKKMDDFQRLHAFHDWLVYFVEYDFDLYNQVVQNPSLDVQNMVAFNLSGAIIDKKAVCEGLSKAFVALCALSGIESYIITGVFDDVDHAWNKVELDGVWYNVDITANAQNVKISGVQVKQVTHGFFLISDDAIKHSETGRHVFGNATANPINPPCTQNYDVYAKIRIYSTGSYNHYAKLMSKESLLSLFSHIKSDKGIGKIEVQLAFESEDYMADIESAYKLTKDSSFRVADKPWVALPNNAYMFLIYK